MDIYEQLQACLVTDDVHMHLWDEAIYALGPYDDFAWNKYFKAIQVLDKFNWVHCAQQPDLAQLIDSDLQWWASFWSQNDSTAIMDQRAAENQQELDSTVAAIQQAWANADAPAAGAAYGHFWGILIGYPKLY